MIHITEGFDSRLMVKRDSLFEHVDMGHILTLAGCVVTMVASFITSEQQKQTNHEIAKEVAEILREEMRKGGEV